MVNSATGYTEAKGSLLQKKADIQESIAEEALKQDINQVVFDVTNSYININRLIKQKSAIQETISFLKKGVNSPDPGLKSVRREKMIICNHR